MVISNQVFVIQKVKETLEEFEKRIKRGFDYKQPGPRKEVYVRGLRDNHLKGFKNECLYIPR